MKTKKNIGKTKRSHIKIWKYKSNQVNIRTKKFKDSIINN